MLVAFGEIAVNGGFAFGYRGVVAVADDRFGHAAEDGLDDVEVRRAGGERCQYYFWLLCLDGFEVRQEFFRGVSGGGIPGDIQGFLVGVGGG
jgi:hypothetical protein